MMYFSAIVQASLMPSRSAGSWNANTPIICAPSKMGEAIKADGRL
jgi:hypothetical protein